MILEEINSIKSKTKFRTDFDNLVTEFMSKSIIMDKFIENPGNWPLFVENIKFGYDKSITNVTNEELASFSTSIMKCIANLQISDSRLTNFYLNLSKSYQKYYLNRKHSIKGRF